LIIRHGRSAAAKFLATERYARATHGRATAAARDDSGDDAGAGRGRDLGVTRLALGRSAVGARASSCGSSSSATLSLLPGLRRTLLSGSRCALRSGNDQSDTPGNDRRGNGPDSEIPLECHGHRFLLALIDRFNYRLVTWGRLLRYVVKKSWQTG
jgi:hypothetical protein